MNEPRGPANINDIASDIINSLQKGTVKEDDLVQLIELCGGLLNLQTISDYARSKGISYNGAKHNRETRELFNVKFIIDND